jgi:hypothetical protein
LRGRLRGGSERARRERGQERERGERCQESVFGSQGGTGSFVVFLAVWRGLFERPTGQGQRACPAAGREKPEKAAPYTSTPVTLSESPDQITVSMNDGFGRMKAEG